MLTAHVPVELVDVNTNITPVNPERRERRERTAPAVTTPTATETCRRNRGALRRSTLFGSDTSPKRGTASGPHKRP